MKSFDNVSFRGVFRDYQEDVLEHSDKYLKDGKIHIVAAPGSGKTILGLELIRRLGRPALILSPTVIIRQQWGERFESGFLPDQEHISDYFSNDLKKPGLITSITYQALHAAFNKTVMKNEENEADDDEPENDDSADFTGFDLIGVFRQSGIGTICLDEAHHLRSEWQRALEGFIEAVGKEVRIISLTATPPYDSSLNEWNRYTSLCGDIDDEIFVPQLVSEKTLCPHQDYIYFSYPTDEEAEIFNDHKAKAIFTTEKIISGGLLTEVLQASGILVSYREKSEFILENVKQFIALLCLARHGEIELPKKLVKLVSPSGKLPLFRLIFAEEAFQFIIDSPDIFTEEISGKLRAVLSQNSLIEKKKVCLKSNVRINKMLISSVGKLRGINEIVRSESKQLGSRLRMLILTDYIKKDMLSLIGTDKDIDTMGTVPVFESVRRQMGTDIRIALLSGSLVILPDDIIEAVINTTESSGKPAYTAKALARTGYSEIVFSGTNKGKVALITEAFRKGYINILVGTKSLLGEGWDSPCINSLILASFVGSFMLSNQMRGRAIRSDINNPGKTSNIWHLVTVEPPLMLEKEVTKKLFAGALEDKNHIAGEDFETMERRFNCFLAPAYNRDIIESGIERIDILKPPYDRDGIENINRNMLALSVDRAGMAERWSGSMKGFSHPEIMDVSEVPAAVQPKSFLFRNLLAETMLSIFLASSVNAAIHAVLSTVVSIPIALLSISLSAVIIYYMILVLIKILRHITPEKSIKTLSGCVLDTLKEIGEIDSKHAKVRVKADPLGLYVICALEGATVHEKNIFAGAVGEMLSAIGNPRYLIIKNIKFFKWSFKHYFQSYACPSLIGANKESAELLVKNLKSSTGGFELLYTRNEYGRRELLRCRRRSYMNINESMIRGKKTLNSKWE